MNITGPIQSSLPPIQDSVEQFLKVNQRIAGEVLHVSNDQVVLAVNGVQIVAKMTSAEQLALLMDKRYAYFIVKDISDSQITLQLTNSVQLTNEQKQTTQSNLSQVLLEQLGIAVEKNNLIIVQAALDRGIKITPELINDIKKVLDRLPQQWGSREANHAISIKSAGLPLNETTIELAQNAVKEIKSNFTTLFNQMTTAANRSDVSSGIQELLRYTQNYLKEVIIQSGNSTENIEKNLLAAVKNMGVSLENEIGKVVHPESRESQLANMSGLLFSLANLRHELGQTNLPRLTTAIDNFLQGMRWMHFINVEPETILSKGQWTQLDLPVTFGFQPTNQMQPDSVHEMQIRIAHDNGEEPGKQINPDYTRLIIQVELGQEETIKVDLSIVTNLIGAEITASSEDICLRASEELSELQTGLSKMGYTLKTSKIDLGFSKIEMNMNESTKVGHSVTSIDLGV